MKYNFLGNSGLKVSALGFGAGTLGGKGQIFSAWGNAGQQEANQMIGSCLEAGVNFFDTADVYSEGESERILGRALASHRQNSIISTKVSVRTDEKINHVGFSRHYLIHAVEQSLKRLQTDYIDILQLHQFDSFTPLEQLMSSLDQLVKSGKVRYIGAYNFSAWQLMKAQSIAERFGYEKFVTHQVYYSLIGRDYEWELMPLNHDQNIGAVVWSPLGWGRLTGRFDRQHAIPEQSRLHQTAQFAPPVNQEYLYQVIDVLKEISLEISRPISANCFKLGDATSDSSQCAHWRSQSTTITGKSGNGSIYFKSTTIRSTQPSEFGLSTLSLLSVLEWTIFRKASFFSQVELFRANEITLSI